MKIGYLGPAGSFSQEALRLYFKDKTIEEIPYTGFEDIADALEANEITYGVLPFENSSTGGIFEVYELMGSRNFSIIGEKIVHAKQNLLGIKSTDYNEISTIYSIRHAYNQSKDSLKDLKNITLIETSSTSESAKTVKALNDPHVAAIGSAMAASLYGLTIIKKDINHNSKNFTRFIIVGKQENTSKEGNKISVILTLPHSAGSLYNALGCFSDNEINLYKIESRPIIDAPWEYIFFIDLSGNLEDCSVKKALAALTKMHVSYKIIGNYKQDSV